MKKNVGCTSTFLQNVLQKEDSSKERSSKERETVSPLLEINTMEFEEWLGDSSSFTNKIREMHVRGKCESKNWLLWCISFFFYKKSCPEFTWSEFQGRQMYCLFGIWALPKSSLSLNSLFFLSSLLLLPNFLRKLNSVEQGNRIRNIRIPREKCVLFR